jgi:hypothetical protein
VIAYTASDEAQACLARLILVPPATANGQARPCDAEILWRDAQRTEIREVRQVATNLATETILAAPFALDQTLRPRHWEVETRFTTAGALTTSTFRGPAINPPIQRWRVRYAGREDWIVRQADVSTRLTITEPYEARLDPASADTAEASARIELAESMRIWLDTWTNGGLTLEVDGLSLGSGQPRPTLAGLAGQWQTMRHGPVALSPGRHTISVRLSAPAATPTWVFGALLVDESGAPLTRCAQVADEPDSST